MSLHPCPRSLLLFVHHVIGEQPGATQEQRAPPWPDNIYGCNGFFLCPSLTDSEIAERNCLYLFLWYFNFMALCSDMSPSITHFLGPAPSDRLALRWTGLLSGTRVASRTCDKYLMASSKICERSHFCTIIGFVSAWPWGEMCRGFTQCRWTTECSRSSLIGTKLFIVFYFFGTKTMMNTKMRQTQCYCSTLSCDPIGETFSLSPAEMPNDIRGPAAPPPDMAWQINTWLKQLLLPFYGLVKWISFGNQQTCFGPNWIKK